MDVAGSEHSPALMAVWCPDGPVVAASAAAGIAAEAPVAVLAANRVVAC
ncbi:MAG: hypothetical protein HOQ24_05120, partial [Mycobacteriaceae bacterium]|nr:hypothetical protein [Mycobacteriaceae bacterium]